MKIADALSAVEKAVLEYKRILNEVGNDDLETKPDFLKDKLNNASEFLAHITSSKAEMDEVLNSAGVGKVQHRIRVCGTSETPLRLGILFGLLVVLLLAVYATYRLHKIADYRVKYCNPLRALMIFSSGTFQLIQNCDGVHTDPQIQSDTSLPWI